MRRATTFVIAGLLVVATGALVVMSRQKRQDQRSSSPARLAENRYAGSRRCRDCHETFYQLWSTVAVHRISPRPCLQFFASVARRFCHEITTLPRMVRVRHFRNLQSKAKGVLGESI
jgi:hypothetical protein